MSDDIKVFVHLLRALHTAGLLKEVIIVGGWCQIIYRKYFENPPELSPLRTADLDILIPRPPRFSHPQRISKLMTELGYEEETAGDGSTHYVSMDLNVEFLIPEIGRGSEKPYRVDALGISAQQLRLLEMLQAATMIVPFEGLTVRVPDPVVFAFHKLLVSKRRTDKRKTEKDILRGKELLSLLASRPKWREGIAKHYQSLSRNRKADLLKLSGVSTLNVADATRVSRDESESATQPCEHPQHARKAQKEQSTQSCGETRQAQEGDAAVLV